MGSEEASCLDDAGRSRTIRAQRALSGIITCFFVRSSEPSPCTRHSISDTGASPLLILTKSQRHVMPLDTRLIVISKQDLIQHGAPRSSPPSAPHYGACSWYISHHCYLSTIDVSDSDPPILLLLTAMQVIRDVTERLWGPGSKFSCSQEIWWRTTPGPITNIPGKIRHLLLT